MFFSFCDKIASLHLESYSFRPLILFLGQITLANSPELYNYVPQHITALHSTCSSVSVKILNEFLCLLMFTKL